MGTSVRQCATGAFIALLVSVCPARGESARAFYTDFDGPMPPEFSGVTTTDSVQGFAGTGHADRRFAGSLLHNTTLRGPDFYAQRTRLTLTNLPAHDSVELNFLLASINTWDGNDDDPKALRGDRFYVEIDGVVVFKPDFDFSSQDFQDYVPPPGVLLTARDPTGFHFDRGFDNPWGDAGYDMGREPALKSRPHSAATLTVELYAGGHNWEGANGESWGIDNFEVVLNGVVPEPTGACTLLPLLLLTKRRARGGRR